MTIQIEACKSTVLLCGVVYSVVRNLASSELTACSFGFYLKNGSSRGSRPERMLRTHMYLQSERCKFTFDYADCS